MKLIEGFENQRAVCLTVCSETESMFRPVLKKYCNISVLYRFQFESFEI